MIAILVLDQLAEAPAGLLLLLKATAVLAAAWTARAALARANPRWRVLTWRAAAAGLAAVAALALTPPIVTWRVAATPRAELARVDHGPPSMPAPPAEPGPAAEDAPPQATLGPDGAVETTRAADLAGPTRAPAPPAAPSEPIGIASWLTAAWLAGVAAGLVRFAVGAMGLSRVVRRSSPASGSVVEACRTTAEALGVRQAVRIVVAPGLASPCLAGVIRPTILLPGGMGLDSPGPDLDAVLVHELTHVRNGDMAWNDALHLASIALWFHPLAWRIRAAHAAACDAVCDAVAVDRLGDVATYGRALARLALRSSTPAPARGLAMARACDVRRRVESLQRMVYRSPLPRRLVMPALLLTAALALLVGGAAVIRAQEDPAKSDGPAKRSIVVRVLGAAGAPLEGVDVAYRHVSRRNLFGVNGRRTTAADGIARVEFDPAQADLSFSLTLRKPGFVPAHFEWSGERRPIQIPEARDIRLARGTAVGGIVTDDAGKGIVDAVVTLSMPPTESDIGDVSFTLASVKTVAQGRWRIDEAPDALQAIHVRVEHPRYRWSYGRLARGLDGLTAVLKEGTTVKGSVVGPGGQPIAGARVTLGREDYSSTEPEARTDERGAFALENCKVGPAFLTVQAEGFSPQAREVVVADEGETPLSPVSLAPGATIRARVVDVEGRPVVGAYVAADRWQGRQAIEFRANTDGDGRIAWRSAPKDVVLFDVFLNGYMRTRQVPLIAGEEETIALRPALTIAGAVTDAKTGRPVSRFIVYQGRTEEDRDGVTWRRDEPAEFTDGRYTQSMEFPARRHHLLIEAPGYKPAESRAFRSDEGATTQDFALDPQAGVEGLVLLPDGRPAAGADVAVDLPGVYTSLKGDRIERYLGTPLQKTGDDGRFWFPKPERSFLVVAAHAEGFALAPPEDFAGPATLRLQRWARIEGRVMVGKRPGAGEEVTFQPHPLHLPQALGISGDYGAVTRADSEGRFVLDKVVPSPGYVGRVVVTDLGEGSSSHAPVGMKAVETKPGETARVEIGGDGRPVVGRVVLDGQPDLKVDWIHNEPAQIVLTPGLLYSLFRGAPPRPGPQPRYAASFDAEGRFRADDLPPGRYRLTVDVAAPTQPGSRQAPATIARGGLNFTVPAGDGEIPFDVGQVVAKSVTQPNRRDDPAEAQAPAPARPALVVHVLDAATGQPLEGAEVESSFLDLKADKRTKATVTTAADGTARVDHDPGVEPSSLSLIARKPGYVPGSYYRGQGGRGEPFPMPDSKEFRLVRGTELVGMVVDEAGAPVEGATVKIAMPSGDPAHPLRRVEATHQRTDARGRWRSAEVPEALRDVNINIAHPDYRGASVEAARGDLLAVLTKGETVTGRVVGPGGRPILGAKVKLRQGPSSVGIAEATTDAEGRFSLQHAMPGEFYVMAEADGFAPAFRDVAVKRGDGAEGVEVAMEPGVTIRVRAVDADGRPLPGVLFAPYLVRGREWASSFRAKTDAEGRAAWKEAPAGESTYTFSCRDRMTVRTPLTPGDEERVIVMRPPLVVSGSVVDAATNQPIPKFRVEYGVIGEGGDRPTWQFDAKDATDGRYSMTFDFPQVYAIRVTARGYKTAESPGFRVDDPGASTQDFALETQPWVEGVVRRPDGNPDATAQVALLTPKTSARLDGTSFVSGPNAPVVAVDADGRFAFPRPDPPCLLAAASEAGYVEVRPEDLAKPADLQLRPWGRIEGTVRIGDKPGAGEWVVFWADRRSTSTRASGLWVSTDDKIQADAQGRFVLDRVVPRPGYVSRALTMQRNPRRYSIAAEPVDVKPGETARVDIGGGGRPVVGRAVFDGPVDWPLNSPAQIRVEYGILDLPAEGGPRHAKTYVGGFDRDGRFRIEDVPPGRYRLNIQADPQVPPTQPVQEEPIAKTVRLLVIPGGDPSTPVEVGEIVVRRERKFEVGDPAPALDLERIDSAKGRYVLGDRRGRVVVLCFWASWAKPFATLMPRLKELNKAHGGDPRFELVGVSCDDDPAEAARFARENGMTWTQAFAGTVGAGATADFGVTDPWSLVMVGPDGRILMPGMGWDDLPNEVAKALAGMEPSSTR